VVNRGRSKAYHHLTLPGEHERGISELRELSSLAFLEGYYYKPRLDWDLLERYNEGLIATSGCLAASSSSALTR